MSIKTFIENLEAEEVLIFDKLPLFLNILSTYLFGLLIFLFCTIILIPVAIRSIFLTYERWYAKKHADKIEAKRLANLKQSVKQALDAHAIKCLKTYPYKLRFSNSFYPDSNLTEFLFKFFHIYNQHNNTIDHNGNVTCSSGRRRSLGDIFLICKYYYPECTIHDVIKILINMLEKDYLRASYCNQINKYVFHVELGCNYIRDSKVEYEGIESFRDVINTYKDDSI